MVVATGHVPLQHYGCGAPSISTGCKTRTDGDGKKIKSCYSYGDLSNNGSETWTYTYPPNAGSRNTLSGGGITWLAAMVMGVVSVGRKQQQAQMGI